jgi:hypothetical protein
MRLLQAQSLPAACERKANLPRMYSLYRQPVPVVISLSVFFFPKGIQHSALHWLPGWTLLKDPAAVDRLQIFAPCVTVFGTGRVQIVRSAVSSIRDQRLGDSRATLPLHVST